MEQALQQILGELKELRQGQIELRQGQDDLQKGQEEFRSRLTRFPGMRVSPPPPAGNMATLMESRLAVIREAASESIPDHAKHELGLLDRQIGIF